MFQGPRSDIDPTDVGREKAKVEAAPAQAKGESMPAVERGRVDIQGVLEQLSEKTDKLLLDVGGSMDPHIKVMEELFSAAKTEFKHMENFYFHNFFHRNKDFINALFQALLGCLFLD